MPVKQPSASKSLRQFSETLNVKPKTAFRRLCAAKSKRKAIMAGGMLCSSIPEQRGHTKINECVKIALYNWIIQYHQVLKYPISNDCVKLSIYDQAVP